MINMGQTGQRTETTSRKQEFAGEKISLEELFQKFQKNDIDHKIYLVRESPYDEDEVFEIVGNLGTGRSCYVFLALLDKKLVSLRMSYEQTDFENKFDSVRVEMEDGYDEYFLNILYPSIPIDHLCVGSVRKKNILSFDRSVYTSFWEKAEATLDMKLAAGVDNKLQWFRQCLKGLRMIHALGRAHFDIKLGNLFLVNNRLKIGDFEYYLKIEDFIRSKIFYCGTPGHMAPEMFYDKENLTERIDIFSAGVAFARLFTAAEPAEDLNSGAVTAEEKERLRRLPTEKIQEAFKNNFKIFNFYKEYLQKELKKAELPAELRAIYPMLLSMMSIDPAARPDINMIIRQVDEILERREDQFKTTGKGIEIPVFKINGTPVVIVNLNKKSFIEIGSIRRNDPPADNGSNDINLRFVDISRRHLQLHYTADNEEKIRICDLHSTYGVFLNNERLEPGNPRALITGDIIQLGSIISFRFTEEEGFYLLKNITQERKKGNLLWLDKDQVNQLPDRQAVIILLKQSVCLTPLGIGKNTTLIVDEKENIDIQGWPIKAPVNGEIIL